jgi:hypothetical protein
MPYVPPMTLALAFILLVLTVPLAGGRLALLEEVRLRSLWLAGLALFVQVVVLWLIPDANETALRIAHLCSYALAGACVLRNLHIPFAWVIGLGGLLNVLAIAANGGVMPARRGALQAAGLDVGGTDFANSDYVEGANLAFLGDVFAIPAGWPGANVFSIGDIVLVLGVLLALHVLCGSRFGNARANELRPE